MVATRTPLPIALVVLSLGVCRRARNNADSRGNPVSTQVATGSTGRQDSGRVVDFQIRIWSETGEQVSDLDVFLPPCPEHFGTGAAAGVDTCASWAMVVTEFCRVVV